MMSHRVLTERLAEVAEDPGESPRLGRTPATTRREISEAALGLFLQRGFDETFVDDIAAAAGISRRTFFRYFPTKNELPWGEFDELIDALRRHLASADPDLPVEAALREALLAVNDYPESELRYHRQRMSLLLNVPSLAAHATIRYTAWRQVVAGFVAERISDRADALAPQAIAWACLGLCIGAYEQWVAHEDAELGELLADAFRAADGIFGVRDPGTPTA